ncbi:MAG TPA: hypothetical protein VK473_05060 [Terriglobales bacterium]|nr:hypothetical protein [Terriglobales bacterium]
MKSLTMMTKTLMLTATMTAILSIPALAQQEVDPDRFDTPPAAAPAQQQSSAKTATVKKTNNQQSAQSKRSKRTTSAQAGANQSAQDQAALLAKVTY